MTDRHDHAFAANDLIRRQVERAERTRQALDDVAARAIAEALYPTPGTALHLLARTGEIKDDLIDELSLEIEYAGTSNQSESVMWIMHLAHHIDFRANAGDVGPHWVDRATGQGRQDNA